jgi:hypothetical protein
MVSKIIIWNEATADGCFIGLPDKEFYTAKYPESPGCDGLLIFSQLKISVMWDLAQHLAFAIDRMLRRLRARSLGLSE